MPRLVSINRFTFEHGHEKPACRETSGANILSFDVRHDPAAILQKFVDDHGIKTLNVAGSRESKDAGIYQWVKQVLAGAFFSGEEHTGMLGGPGGAKARRAF